MGAYCLNNYISARISNTADFMYAVNPDLYFANENNKKRKFE